MTDKVKYGEYAGITGKLDEPAKSASKRYRIKRCNAKLRVPDESTWDDVVFTCQKQAGHIVDANDQTTWHEERIIVDYGNSSARESVHIWRDMGLVATRRRMQQLKITPVE